MFLIGIMSVTACNKVGEDVVPGYEDVYISAATTSVEVPTRVPYMLTAPTYDNPLNVDVWASTISGEYEAANLDGSGPDGIVKKHTTAKFQSSQHQLLSDIIYSNKNQGVYFVGFHPNDWDGKSVTENGKEVYNATFGFTGCEDVMFAPQTKGSYGSTTNPKLIFHHLLTYITVEIKIDAANTQEEESIINAWGNLTHLKISSSNRVSVGLSDSHYPDNASYNFDSGVAFENDNNSTGSLNFFKKGTNTAFPDENEGYKMRKEGEDVAYVMCSPVDASTANTEEYVLYIKTSNRDAMNVPLDLKTVDSSPYQGSTRGKHFKVLLNFKKGENITISTSVTDWATGGTAIGNIVEGNIQQENNTNNENQS